jgi:hypothetical protein
MKRVSEVVVGEPIEPLGLIGEPSLIGDPEQLLKPLRSCVV